MPDHDLQIQALVHDPPELLGRRRMLQLMGMTGVVVLAGCGSNNDTTTTASSATTSTSGSSETSSTAASTSCTQIPEETAGPYPGDGSNGPNVLTQDGVVRSDIRSSFGSSNTVAEGVPLTIEFTVLDATGCTALAGAAVYVWHCDREGRYSMYSSGAENENYLRGVQETDANGKATFTSIFPAAYDGRWPHIHFEVYESVDAATSGGHRIATSQIAIPEATCEAVYATDGYDTSVQNLASTSLEDDNVFGDDDAVSQLGTVTGDVNSGFTVALRVPVDPSATSSSGSIGGGSGGAPPGRP